MAPSLYTYTVSPDEISSGDTSIVEGAVVNCVEVDLSGNTVLNYLMLGTSVFDNDPRALFDIPEMRKWCASLNENVPHVFCVLHPITIQWLFPCVAPIEIVARRQDNTDYIFVETDTRMLLAHLRKSARAFLGQYTSNKEETERLVKQAVDRLHQAFPLTESW